LFRLNPDMIAVKSGELFGKPFLIAVPILESARSCNL
jgi:hypothetical protein